MLRYYSIEDLKSRLCRVFRDDHRIQWSDALLDEIIFEAQREYALYSGCLQGTFDIVSSGGPVMACPEDFIKVVRVTGSDGKELPIVSYRELAARYGDFRKITGSKAKYIVFDFDGHKRFRIFPTLPQGAFAGTVHYERLPQNNVLEVKNIEAVEAYALYMMFLMTGKDLAAVWYKKFMELVLNDTSSFHKVGITDRLRSGRYY